MRKKVKYDDVINRITSEEVVRGIVMAQLEKKRDEGWLQSVEKDKQHRESSDSPVPEEISVTVVLNKHGKVSVNGPLADKPLCVYLLDVGKDLCKAWVPPTTGTPKPKTKGAYGGGK